MLYIDTSALAAYYVPEAKSAKVEKIISARSAVAISPLVELEMFSALSRKVRAGEIDIPDAQKVAGMFDLHLQDGLFDIVPIESREYAIARRWIGQFSTPLRTLDALHLAVAFCNGLTLLTADRHLADSAKQLGVSFKFI